LQEKFVMKSDSNQKMQFIFPAENDSSSLSKILQPNPSMRRFMKVQPAAEAAVHRYSGTFSAKLGSKMAAKYLAVQLQKDELVELMTEEEACYGTVPLVGLIQQAVLYPSHVSSRTQGNVGTTDGGCSSRTINERGFDVAQAE
jgi:hypothetical protein